MYQSVKSRVSNQCKESIVLSHKGQDLYGVWHYPKDRLSYPALILCPGFGSQKSGGFRIYVELAERLCEKGIATLRFDYRGYGDSDGDFFDVTLSSQVEDVVFMMDYLKENESIHSLSILGGSLGGRIALHAALECIESLHSLLLWVPLITSLQWEKSWEQLKEKNPNFKYQDFQGQRVNAEFVNEFFTWPTPSLIPKLTHLPLFTAYSELDEILTPQHIKELKFQRKSAKAPTTYLELKEADHRFSEVSVRQTLLDATIDYLVSQYGEQDESLPFKAT
jgi:pimeloyl-ACP methyl ester carboxylesterase